jgi:hypothetical protein
VGKVALRGGLKFATFFDFISLAFPKWDGGDIEKADFSTPPLTKA